MMKLHHAKLRKVKEDDDMEMFVTLFETTLISWEVLRRDWKNSLHAHLTLNAKFKVLLVLQNNESTYDDISTCFFFYRKQR